MSALGTNAIANLKPEAVAALSLAQLGAWSSDQLSALSDSQIAALTTTQIQTLTAAQLSGVQQPFLQGLTSTQLQALSIAQLSAQPLQVSAFTTTQLAQLSQAQRNALVEPISDLGQSTGVTVQYNPSGSVSGGATIVDGYGSDNIGTFLTTDNKDGTQTEVYETSTQLNDGSFEATLSGGYTPTASSPSSGVSVIPVPSNPPTPPGDIVLQGTPFQNLFAAPDANGDGWYRTGSPSDPDFQISYNPSINQWDYSNVKTGKGVWQSGLGGRDSYADVYASYQAAFKNAPLAPSDMTNKIFLVGTPFVGLTAGSTGNNWYQVSDPNGYNYLIRFNGATNQWQFSNKTSGNVGTGSSFQAAYNNYQTAFGDAPAYGPGYSVSYYDQGFVANPTDGVHQFTSTVAQNLLFGGTGVLMDGNDTTNFAPPDGNRAAVIGANGSISQSIGGMTQGAWYAISFQAMTTVFDEYDAPSWTTSSEDGRAAAAPQSISITLDGQSLGVVTTGTVPGLGQFAASDWQMYATEAFIATSGSHTLVLTGTAPNGNKSSITIDNLQLLQITPSASVKEPKGGIDSLSPQKIAGLSADVLLGASDAQLQGLTTQQFQAITSGQLNAFWGAAISRFTNSQLESMTTTQVASLLPNQVAWLGSAVLNNLSPAQLQSISDLSGISIADLKRLTSSTLSEFTATQDATLTKAQLGALPVSSLLALDPNIWPLLGAAQVSGLSAGQLAALPQADINAISDSALLGLSIGTNLTHWLNMPSAGQAAPTDLHSLYGNVTQLSVNGTLAAAIGTGDYANKAFFWNGGAWQNLGGSWQKVVVGGDGSIWGISSSGEVNRFVVDQWIDQKLAGSDIAVGGDGSVYVVGSTNSLGGTVYQWSAGQWTALKQSFSKVAVGGGGSLWGIGTDGRVYQSSNGVSVDKGISGSAIAAGGDGSVIVLGAKNVAGGNTYEWNHSGGWISEAATLSNIGVDNNGIAYGIDSAGAINQLNPDSSWTLTFGGSIGSSSYYGSTNPLHAAAAALTINALSTIATSLGTGSSSAQAAAAGLTSAIADIKSGNAAPAETLEFNLLANALTLGNPYGVALGVTGSPVASVRSDDASTIASLIGALALEGGALLDPDALTFVAVGGAVTALRTGGLTSFSQVVNAFASTPDAASAGPLSSLANVGFTIQNALGYQAAAKAIGGFSDGTLTGMDAGTLLALQNVDSNEALGASGATQIASLGDAQIKTLTASQLSTLSLQQVQAFSRHQIGLLSAGQLNSLLQGQVEGLSEDTPSTLGQVSAIAAGQVAQLSPAFLNSLGTLQVQSLTPGQVAALSVAQIQQLSAGFISALTAPQLKKLSDQQLAALNAYQINAISTGQLLGLSQRQISSLNQSQIQLATSVQPSFTSGWPTPGPISGDPGWPPPPQSILVATGADTSHGSSFTQLYHIIDGPNLVVDLNAHFVPQSGPLHKIHCWLDITSDYGTLTLSFEPDHDGVGDVFGVFPLRAVLDADDQGTAGPDGVSCLLTPVPIKPPAGSSYRDFALNLAHAFEQYDNKCPYIAVPSALDFSQCNSNSGISTLLRMVGVNPFDPNQIPNIIINDGQSIRTVNLARDWVGAAPGWGHQIPIQYFDNPIEAVATVTNPNVLSSALLNTGYLRNLILQSPGFVRAFNGGGGNLAALNELVNAFEQIDHGGLLNIATGGLNLFLSGERLLGIGQTAPSLSLQGWLNQYGPAGLAALEGVVNGFQQGGITGGFMAGLSADEFVVALDRLMGILLKTGAVTGQELETAAIVGIVVGLCAVFFGGDHSNPATGPDEWDTARFTQYVGELQGSASTKWGAPYDPARDPIQTADGGLSELSYIQDWIKANLNSRIAEVRREAQKLLPLYGDDGTGKLGFQQGNLKNEWVIGGTEKGTYVSIQQDAQEAIGEIDLLNAGYPTDVQLPPSAKPPSQDYGGLAWVPFFLPGGTDVGYWAPKSDGSYYYFGPDNKLYHDAYAGEVQAGDVNSNLIGNVTTYNFGTSDNPSDAAAFYGGLSFG